MNYLFAQEIYNQITTQLFDSSIMLLATVNIASQNVTTESIYGDYGDSLDARIDPIKKTYPDGVSSFYKIKVYPTSHGMRLTGQGFEYKSSGKVDNYDTWVSCFEKDAQVRNRSNMFDLAANVELQGIRYRLNGVVKELFGTDTILHVFLSKETQN